MIPAPPLRRCLLALVSNLQNGVLLVGTSRGDGEADEPGAEEAPNTWSPQWLLSPAEDSGTPICLPLTSVPRPWGQVLGNIE